MIPESPPTLQTVAIVGVGLIGGSFALALKKAGFTGQIFGVSSPATVDAALRAGAIDKGVSLSEAGEVADLIYLSQPIDRILETLPILPALVRPDCLITDAGSTKSEIVRIAFEAGLGSQFLGGHPMAGKESRGVAAADPDLFVHRPYVLTLASQGEPIYGRAFRHWLQRIGARIIEMNAEQHDRTVAGSSHLPQLLATTLALTLSQANNESFSSVFGPGLLDMTRLALSAPEVWLSVLRTNRAYVADVIRSFRTELERVEEALPNDDEFQSLFSEAALFAQRLRQTS